MFPEDEEKSNALDEIAAPEESIETPDDIEMLDSGEQPLNNQSYSNGEQTRFGEKEYQAARNSQGKFDKNYYKNKDAELAQKEAAAKEEASKKTKEVADLDENGNAKWKDGETPKSRTWENGKETTAGMPTKSVKKSKMEQLKDDVNLMKAKNARFNNRINGAKANMYRMAHPIETKKEEIKDAAKQQVKKVAKEAAQKGKKAIASGAKKAAAKLLANPYVLAGIGAVVLLFIIIVAIISVDEGGEFVFKSECDFNRTKVTYKSCSTNIEMNEDLKNYVINTTYKIASGRDFTDDQIKALMIIVKTKALGDGNYNNVEKHIEISDCDIENLYTTSNGIVIHKLNNLVSNNSLLWWPVGSLETIVIDGKTYATGKPSSTRIISHYGGRNAPTEGASTNHMGIDIGNNYHGDGVNNVIASLDGTVTEVSYTDHRGYYVKIDHGTIQTLYQHLYSGSITVSVGETVHQGQAIAKMGSTGVSTGAHLHFEVFVNGSNVDPEDYVDPDNTRPVPDNTTTEETTTESSETETIATETGNTETDRYQQLYTAIENELYIKKNYTGTIESFDESDSLELNDAVLTNISSSNAGYTQIIESIYDDSDKYVYSLKGNCEMVNKSDSASYDDLCDSISMITTPLAREEFVFKTKEYFNSRNSSWGNSFAAQADVIYDISVKNGFNPELIVIRAILEGGSPVSHGYNYNNYWGIGCFNTAASLSSCKSYPSFDEGVLGYANILKGYGVDNLLEVYSVKHYAYIGDNWYNPGNSGLGGCYYYPYIKKFMSDERSAIVGAACASGNECSGSNCLKTNDEDQLAYSKYQIQSTLSMRKTVFGIDNEDCGDHSENCKLFAQGNADWGNISLGSSSTNMKNSGCAVTSIAIGISCSGTKLNVSDFNPGVLIRTLNDGNCFDAKGNIYWSCQAINKIAPDVTFINSHSGIKSKSNEEKNGIIASYNLNNHFILLHYVNDSHPRGHYVVYSSTSGNYYSTKDPSGGKVTSVLISDIDQIVVYSTKKDVVSV